MTNRRSDYSEKNKLFRENPNGYHTPMREGANIYQYDREYSSRFDIHVNTNTDIIVSDMSTGICLLFMRTSICRAVWCVHFSTRQLRSLPPPACFVVVGSGIIKMESALGIQAGDGLSEVLLLLLLLLVLWSYIFLKQIIGGRLNSIILLLLLYCERTRHLSDDTGIGHRVNK